MNKFLTLVFTASVVTSSYALADTLLDGSTPTDVPADSVELGTDTTGDYVSDITANGGVSSTGATSGEDISHTLSVDQSFSPSWTGAHTFTPATTSDLVINLDSDTNMFVRGAAALISDDTAAGVLSIHSAGSLIFRIDSDNDSSAENFVVQTNAGTELLVLTEAGNATFTGTVGGSNLSGTNTGDETAGNGISITTHSVSVDQDYDFIFTGNVAFTPASTDDVVINTDADSVFRVFDGVDTIFFQDSNIGLGLASFGTNASSTLSIANNVAPTTAPADVVQIYASDFAAGDSRLFIRAESGGTISLGNDNLIFNSADGGASVGGEGSLIVDADRDNDSAGSVILLRFGQGGNPGAQLKDDGTFKQTLITGLVTCDSASVGSEVVYRKGSGGTEATSKCICEEVAGVYGWAAATATGDCT